MYRDALRGGTQPSEFQKAFHTSVVAGLSTRADVPQCSKIFTKFLLFLFSIEFLIFRICANFFVFKGRSGVEVSF